MVVDAFGPRLAALGGLGGHRCRTSGRPDEAKRGRIAKRHVCHPVVGGGIVVFGLGSHPWIGGHGVCGATRPGRGASRPGHPVDLARHLHTSRPHEAHVDVCPGHHQRAVCGLWRVRWTGGTGDAGRCRDGLRGGFPNTQALPPPTAPHWLRGCGFFGGHVQGPGRRHRVCGGGHHD